MSEKTGKGVPPKDKQFQKGNPGGPGRPPKPQEQKDAEAEFRDLAKKYGAAPIKQVMASLDKMSEGNQLKARMWLHEQFMGKATQKVQAVVEHHGADDGLDVLSVEQREAMLAIAEGRSELKPKRKSSRKAKEQPGA